jgi:hypothetical protein
MGPGDSMDMMNEQEEPHPGADPDSTALDLKRHLGWCEALRVVHEEARQSREDFLAYLVDMALMQARSLVRHRMGVPPPGPPDA